MATIGKILMTCAFMSVSAVTGTLAWFAPVMLRAIPEGDFELMGLWLVAFLLLVMMSGGCLIASVAVWVDEGYADD